MVEVETVPAADLRALRSASVRLYTVSSCYSRELCSLHTHVACVAPQALRVHGFDFFGTLPVTLTS